MAGRDPHAAHRSVSGGLARAAVFGVNDGLVSNVSLVLGFAGSGADSSVVRLAGLAGAIAGAVSMAAGEWVSISAQNDLVERELEVERRELLHNTTSETSELVDMYEAHGMTRASAQSAAEQVMREPERALVVHAREEFGVDPYDLPSPWRAAVLSLVCFLVGALAPVVPWFFDVSGTAPKVTSLVIGAVAAAVVGALLGRLSERPLAPAMIRQVLIVLAACAVTYLVGRLVGINVS
ncbi:MAG: VIT1/CCC1 transporter family protein [Acidimicrobiia bacterium]|nr:VIT1/CCC1 transporter family protein [Acidimicrobiia bacterium]